MLSRDARRVLDRIRKTIGVRAVGARLQVPAPEYVVIIECTLLERRQLGMRYSFDEP